MKLTVKERTEYWHAHEAELKADHLKWLAECEANPPQEPLFEDPIPVPYVPDQEDRGQWSWGKWPDKWLQIAHNHTFWMAKDTTIELMSKLMKALRYGLHNRGLTPADICEDIDEHQEVCWWPAFGHKKPVDETRDLDLSTWPLVDVRLFGTVIGEIMDYSCLGHGDRNIVKSLGHNFQIELERREVTSCVGWYLISDFHGEKYDA